MNIPFSFQRSNKAAGCEDAPPIAYSMCSIVCDGLGGAGSTRHTVLEEGTGTSAIRTSGYLGARIVSKCVEKYYLEKAGALFSTSNGENKMENVEAFLGLLRQSIVAAFDDNMQRWDIKPSHSKTLKDFPTTLASAMYYPNTNGLTILAVWAGDSRIYVLTPKKGLQLLSLDDAQNAENEMNSTSEMTNCISAGNNFRFNYAFYELNEPGIVFCCSDGCFDYLPSPLHFEWLILHTIYECMPDSRGDELGKVLADSIRDNMYESIGDDTTMAGIIVGIESGSQMKDLFKGRLDESDKRAVHMHELIKELKQVQNEKDAAQKKCRLSKEKVFLSVHDAVCNAMRSDSIGSMLRSKIMKMPCYAEYGQRERAIGQEINHECRLELEKMQGNAQKTKKVCRDMLIYDYLKWQHVEEQRGASVSLFGNLFSPKNREKTNIGWSNHELKQAEQYVRAFIKMYEHPFFNEVVSLPKIDADESAKYIRDQISRLEAVLWIFSDPDPLLLDLWSQAFYSTDLFIADRNQCRNNPQFDNLFEQAINKSRNYEFVSKLTIKKISEYKKQCNALTAVREKYNKEMQRRIAKIPEEFWLHHKAEILDDILSESEFALRSLFKDTDVQIELLLSYIEAKATLGQVDNKIADIQRDIDRIWDDYKTDYQLFKHTIEKGVC